MTDQLEQSTKTKEQLQNDNDYSQNQKKLDNISSQIESLCDIT